MQYHLNGFRPGDPATAEPAPGVADLGHLGDGGDPDANGGDDSSRGAELPSHVDVLIVGSGPAGLTLATQLSAFPDIETRIVEQKPGPMRFGQADGVACRSMEMFQAFGFAERVAKESYWVNETTFWRPSADDPRRIVRADRIQDVEDGLSEFPHTILSQARIHDFFLDVMARSPRRLVPHYGHRFADLQLDPPESSTGHPVAVTLHRSGPEGGPEETVRVRARYVVGCDGARSQVRRALGRDLVGDSANKLWGVMDVLAVTDFPDIRLKSAIQSAADGSVLIIPREGGYLVRIYTELDELAPGERAADRELRADDVIVAAQRILRPYTLDVKEVAWWSAYEIGQRLTDAFDDVLEGDRARRTPRVLITGDACHTHSPKAGQGMNVSMADSFNLGWKLASVLLGRSPAELLHTYSNERRAVAAELIDFDRDMAKLFSVRADDATSTSVESPDQADFQAYFAKHARYTAGVEIRYGPSAVTGPASHQDLATGFGIGTRFHSAPVIRLADAKPLHLGHALRADGRWRIIVFADGDDPTDPSSSLVELCAYLDHSPESPIRRFTPAGADIDSVVEVLAVVQQPHRSVALEELPSFLLPAKGRYGLIDYEKVYCPDPTEPPDIFDARGVDRRQGCMVVVRPDQYVSHVLPLTARTELEAFFAGVLLPRHGGVTHDVAE